MAWMAQFGLFIGLECILRTLNCIFVLYVRIYSLYIYSFPGRRITRDLSRSKAPPLCFYANDRSVDVLFLWSSMLPRLLNTFGGNTVQSVVQIVCIPIAAIPGFLRSCLIEMDGF